ncbi:hypothetical protein PBR20603_04516 [Pandoraea bronchicola]|uniref:Uncharacterized protein n=1 Tax=Pandoraea bronchicola TaxID=2508287 RepID=A0A5E5BW31_9BURK|nr:hypothetical protein PBR20603_04516 [Pandoraea bronchicola]
MIASRRLSLVLRLTFRFRLARVIRPVIVALVVPILFAAINLGAYWQSAVSLRRIASDTPNSDTASVSWQANLAVGHIPNYHLRMVK